MSFRPSTTTSSIPYPLLLFLSRRALCSLSFLPHYFAGGSHCCRAHHRTLETSFRYANWKRRSTLHSFKQSRAFKNPSIVSLIHLEYAKAYCSQQDFPSPSLQSPSLPPETFHASRLRQQSFSILDGKMEATETKPE